MPADVYCQDRAFKAINRHALLAGLIWTTMAIALSATANRQDSVEILSFLVLWLVGIVSIILGRRRCWLYEVKLRSVEHELWHSSQNMEIKILERTSQLQMANRRLKEEVEERLRTEKALLTSEMKYRIVADNTYGWEFWLNPEGEFIYSSPACRDITGFGADEFIADPELFKRLIFPDDLACYLAHKRDVEDARRTDSVAFRVVRPDGSVRWIGHVCQPVYDDSGTFIGTRGSNRDISGRKEAEDEIRVLNEELERRVRKRTAQLEASNKELEGFCYAISHDLRAPLARLEGYSLAMLEDCLDSMDPQLRLYAERINTSSIQLKEVIDILLELTMLTRTRLKIEEVDLSEMTNIILQDFRRAHPHRAVEAIVATGAVVKGDRRLIMKALRSLFDNSWKYTGKNANATIEFGILPHKRRKTFFIRDDGAGFDMRFARKMFKPFERIHSPDEFPGLGIGLAVAQRIIQRHGGKIWAEGEIEKGATFFFNL